MAAGWSEVADDWLDTLSERGRWLLFLFPATLASVGLLDRQKGEEAFDLAVPAMVTGGLRTLVRTADFFMVSLAAGAVAVAGLELGFQYYFIPFGLGLSLTSGTMSLVSRFLGAGNRANADLTIKLSLWVAVLVSVPITVGSWVYARPLIDLLTNDPRTIALGATYLRIVMLSVLFRFVSLVAARALAAAGDTRTPMYVRLVTLPTNVAINAVLIFGLFGAPALGIAGAAIGTAIANTVAALTFLGILLSGRWPVALQLGGRQWDTGIVVELFRVSLPLAGTRLSRTLGRFPFLFLLGVVGTPVLAAYAIGRRVVLLANMPAWGYSTASSTLVGQAIGGGEVDEAAAYGWEVLRLALATQLTIAAVIAILAEPIAVAFGSQHPDLTVAFVRVFAVGVAAFSTSRTMRGALRGAGDTRFPFYGSLLGTYAVRLPIAALALPVGYVIAIGPVAAGPLSLPALSVSPGMGLGLIAIFASILADMYAKAVVNVVRFRSGAWRAYGSIE